MSRPNLAARVTAAVLVAALVVLAPGLPFYTVFADPYNVTAPVTSAWSSPIGRAAMGFNAPGSFSAAASGKFSANVGQKTAQAKFKAVDWNSAAGKRLAAVIGARIEEKQQITPESFSALEPEQQEQLIGEAMEEAAPEIAAVTEEVAVTRTLTPEVVEVRSARTNDRTEAIARALGQTRAPGAVKSPALTAAPIAAFTAKPSARLLSVPFGRTPNRVAPQADPKPSAVTKVIIAVTQAVSALKPAAMILMPFVAANANAAGINVSEAAALGVSGFVAGAFAAADVAKDILKRTKTTGKAYGGGMTLAILAGGAIAGGAVFALASMSPVAAAVVLSGVLATTVYLGRAPRQHVVAPISVRSGKTGEAGLFDIVKQGEQHLIRIKTAQLGKPYLLSAILEKGLGEKGLYSSWMAGEFLWTFEKAGDSIQLTAKNTNYRAAKGTPLERTFDKSIPNAAVSKAKILAVDETKGEIVVSMDELFTKDILNMNKVLDDELQGQYAQDVEASRLDGVKAFPKNVELRSSLAFTGKAEDPGNLMDSRNINLVLRYSLSALPEGDFTPRKADDRIGFFSTTFQDWTDGQKRDLTTRYVNRWKLEKKDPAAKMSEPKEPIVFWLENTIPVEYREAVSRGILEWNAAFEKIGFKNAVVVKQQPDPKPESTVAAAPKKIMARLAAIMPAIVKAPVEEKASDEEYFDPADARFNVIRWFMNTDDYVLAIGPSRANPFTGQLYNAGIAFHAAFTRPGNTLEMAGIGDPLDQKVKGKEQAKDKKTAHRHTANCNHAAELATHAATALTLAEGRAPMTPEQRKRFVEDFITETIVHEVGHTLGLRHNFAASTWLKPEEMAGKDPFSASVMDYNAPNMAAPGEEQGPFFQTHLGPYDFKAIEYAYKPMDGMNAQQQDKALSDIAASLSAEGLMYATDEDVTGMDPKAQAWDLGSDLVSFAEKRIAIVHDLWQRLEKRELKDGEGYQRLTKAFIGGFREFYRAVDVAVKNIGGINYNREHAGNAAGKVPFQPVSAEEQVRTLEFLDQYVFSDEKLIVSPELLSKLAPERQPTLNDPYPALDYIPYNRMVLAIRLTAIDHLLAPDVLERLQDSKSMTSKQGTTLSAAELFMHVTQSVWLELFMQKPKLPEGSKKRYMISSLRRELQIAYIDRLVVAGFAYGNSSASSHAQRMLMVLASTLKESVKDPSWEPETQAHLIQALQKIMHATEMGPLMVRRAMDPHRGGN